MSRSSPQASIITFIGPVGVGKSTHIGLIKNYLKSKNIRATTTFIKSSHALTYIINEPLILLGAYEKVPYKGGVNRIYPRRDIVRRLFPLWCFLDTFSILMKFFFTVYVPFKLGFTILIEEGLMMTLLTYGRIFPRFFKTNPRGLPLLPTLLGWIRNKNHINIVLDATTTELDQRRKDRSSRQDELPEYINMQKKWINHLDLEDTIFIDTNRQPIIRVHKKIVRVLEKLMNIGD